MPDFPVLQESDVEARVKCPLLNMVSSSEDPWLEQVELLRWALLESFRGRLLTVPQLRFKFETLWSAARDRNGVKQKPYWDGMRSGNLTAKKVFLLTQRYLTAVPYTWRTLILQGQSVLMQYAVLKDRSNKAAAPVVLVERPYRQEFSLQPQPIEMLRAYHLLTTSLHPKIDIMNLPLGRGDPWFRREVNLALVHQYLISILNHVTTSTHPSPGGHCGVCVNKVCRKAFSA